MENIYLLLCFGLIFWYFIFLRKVAEVARKLAQKYCQQENIQYLSIARLSSRLKFDKKLGLYWQSHFAFEFSGDGQSNYTGELKLQNYKLQQLHVPPYRV